jgi:hypothetical protein
MPEAQKGTSHRSGLPAHRSRGSSCSAAVNAASDAGLGAGIPPLPALMGEAHYTHGWANAGRGRARLPTTRTGRRVVPSLMLACIFTRILQI